VSAVTSGPRLRRGTHVGYAVGSIGTAVPRPVAERLLSGVLDLVYRADS